MIDIFEALSWLNVIDNSSYLNNEVLRLSRNTRKLNRFDRKLSLMVERLRNAGQSSGDPLEKAEIFLHCAAIEYWRGWFPRAAWDAHEAVILYKNYDHRRAVAFWMLGTAQWKILRNHNAYASWDEARKIFQKRQTFFQHFAQERDWYKNRIWQMEVQLAARPEEIRTWLNRFEDSNLTSLSQQVVNCVEEKIRRQAYPNVYALIQDLLVANKRSDGTYEKAEVYLSFGLALYQLGHLHFAIELLRTAVPSFCPGTGTYHKQVVARCMSGAVEWMYKPARHQAIVDWTCSIEEFEKLRRWASRDNNQTKRDWYTERRRILCAALSERLR